jgi:hypothetical protein
VCTTSSQVHPVRRRWQALPVLEHAPTVRIIFNTSCYRTQHANRIRIVQHLWQLFAQLYSCASETFGKKMCFFVRVCSHYFHQMVCSIAQLSFAFDRWLHEFVQLCSLIFKQMFVQLCSLNFKQMFVQLCSLNFKQMFVQLCSLTLRQMFGSFARPCFHYLRREALQSCQQTCTSYAPQLVPGDWCG